MIKQVGGKWRRLCRRANDWMRAMDVDPMEDLHSRIRRLELCVSIRSKRKATPACTTRRFLTPGGGES